MNIEFNMGVAEDPRPQEQKERDYTHKKLAGNPVIVWQEKTEWKRYIEREQDGSLSCMAQAGAKAVEILKDKKVYSAHPPYRSRSNFPEGGMWLQDLGDVYKKIGTTFEELDVSQNIGETKMNRDIEVETPYKIGGYGFPNGIDEIAEAIEQHGHCIIMIHCNKAEWLSGMPKFNGKEINFGHGVCATDYFMHEGEKAILIEDSTGHSSSYDKKGARILTESFLKERLTGAMYFTAEIPQYKFTLTMRRGSKGNEVKELQKRLSREVGYNLVKDGIFGYKTMTAVVLYQRKKGLMADGIVGAKTRAKLNGS